MSERVVGCDLLPPEWREHYADFAAQWAREPGTLPRSADGLAVLPFRPRRRSRSATGSWSATATATASPQNAYRSPPSSDPSAIAATMPIIARPSSSAARGVGSDAPVCA